MAGFDRRAALCEQPAPPRVTGIDFVQVVDPHDQHVLQVFFLIDPDTLVAPMVATAASPSFRRTSSGRHGNRRRRRPDRARFSKSKSPSLAISRYTG